MVQRPLSGPDKRELERLNRAVKEAVAARSKWLDAKMIEYASIPVRGKLYCLDSGDLAGKVIQIDRERDQRREALDTDMPLRVVLWWTTTMGGRFDTQFRSYGDLRDRDEAIRASIAALEKKLASGK